MACPSTNVCMCSLRVHTCVQACMRASSEGSTGKIKHILRVGSLRVGDFLDLIAVNAVGLELVRHAQFPERQTRRAHEPLRLEYLEQPLLRRCSGAHACTSAKLSHAHRDTVEHAAGASWGAPQTLNPKP